MSEPAKQSESAKQLAAAEQEAKERFEKAMTELREGAYRFSSSARSQSELIIEELIDPDGDTVASIAEVEGDQGALSLAQSLELITFDTWLFGQIGDKDELDLKSEQHWEVWFTFGAWIGETMRRRHGGHWLMMGDDPHTWRCGFSKIFLEIAPFVFAEQLLRMGSGATKKMVSEVERIRQLHDTTAETTITTRIPFAEGSAEVTPAMHPMIDAVARQLIENPHVELVHVDGFAGTTDAEAGRRLAQQRAEAVVKHLVTRQISSKRLVAKGLAPDAAVESAAANHVTFVVAQEGERAPLLDRFLAQHYIRLHTVPLGQWMSMDFARLAKLWNDEPVAKLIEALKESGPRLGPGNAGIVDQVVQAITRAKQDEPIAKQTTDRGLFEAIAQIVALRRATAPVAIDILERVVMPAMHVGMPEKFPPLDEDDLANLRKGTELFAFFVEVVPHKFQADDEGFLGTIPHEQLTTPYSDRNVLEIGKGDWVVVNPAHFVPMLNEYDPQKLLDKYDDFVKYLRSIPEAPNRRDDGRMLAETAIRALADLKQCVAIAAQNQDALLFRLLPPPG
ncbi:MAG: OmpA family protein [Deltaproteobacteria bacterium]|nr:OmpA family protein [Deltaproteobacteria bacterium]MDQ3299855.1 OmpA family protein [Myxococcota bacterium]